MNTYCECEFPVIDVEHDAGCRRCGRPVDFSPAPEGSWPMALDPYRGNDTGSMDADDVRRIELAAQLAGSTPPAWSREEGAADPRLLLVGAGVVSVLLVVAVAWHYLLAGGVVYAAYRHLSRGQRRRRPRSSYASMIKSAAMLYAAYNSRWLKPTDRRVTVSARAVTAPTEHDVPAPATADASFGEVPF